MQATVPVPVPVRSYTGDFATALRPRGRPHTARESALYISKKGTPRCRFTFASPLLCAYPCDCPGSSGASNSGCGPVTCSRDSSPPRLSGCTWPGNQLRDLLETQAHNPFSSPEGQTYNEVLVSTIDWHATLPGAIEAVVVVHTALLDGDLADDERFARQVYRSLMEYYAPGGGRSRGDLSDDDTGFACSPALLFYNGTAFSEL